MKVFGTMCMMPDRYPKSLSCVMSLKGQVETLYLCLNGFDSIPEDLIQDWIEVVHVGKNIGAVGRYTKLPEIEGHLISVDDDLVYPSTYVSDFVSRYEDEGPVVLTHHGKVISGERSVSASHCLRDSKYSGRIDIPGAGVMFVPYEFRSWNKNVSNEPKNPTDVWAAAIFKKMGVRILSVPHSKDYFSYVEPPKGTTIWETETHKQDLVSLFNQITNKIQS